MTDRSKTNQRDISVTNGDVAGRDVTKSTYVFNGPVSPMTRLCIDFLEESIETDDVAQILPELKHYMKNVDSDKVIGLEAKLTAANREIEIDDAMRQKELLTKRLHQNATSKSAQRIYAHVLGMLLNKFRAHVKPLIEKGANKADIDTAAISNVIEPTMTNLEQNVLDMYWDDLWGMIYYLTGNCHIKWAK